MDKNTVSYLSMWIKLMVIIRYNKKAPARARAYFYAVNRSTVMFQYTLPLKIVFSADLLFMK